MMISSWQIVDHHEYKSKLVRKVTHLSLGMRAENDEEEVELRHQPLDLVAPFVHAKFAQLLQ